MINVSVKTLQRWDNDNVLHAYRNPKGRRYYTHKDRFIRFGYDWFERFLKKNGAEIIIVNNEKLSPQEELVQALINIIYMFSCRIYGLRKYKKKIEGEDFGETSVQDRNQSDCGASE